MIDSSSPAGTMSSKTSPKHPTATHERALTAALQQNWKEAMNINTELLKVDQSNIEVLNRLGFAHMKLGNIPQAKKMLNKVRVLDPYNQIAIKNLKKLETYKGDPHERSQLASMSPMQFLEDPGKTKVAQCVHVAPTHVLSTVNAGQEVDLIAKNHNVEIRDDKKRYLAALPDDLSFRLLKYMAGGNRYRVVVKGVDKNSLSVFLREISRGKKFLNQPSFASPSSYQALTREVPHEAEKPDVTPTGEETDEPLEST